MGFVGWMILIIVVAVAIGIISVMITSSKKKGLADSISKIPDFLPKHVMVGNNGEVAIAVDTDNKRIAIVSNEIKRMTQENGVWPFTRVYRYDDLVSVELLEDGNSVTKTSRSSQAANAVIGGLLLGGVGAVVGALTSSSTTQNKVKRIDLHVIVSDSDNPSYVINFQDIEAAKGGIINAVAIDQARTWIARLSGIIKEADQPPKVVENPVSLNLGVSAELEKLNYLRANGILTESEFAAIKSRILNDGLLIRDETTLSE
jgi:hypothetical protein